MIVHAGIPIPGTHGPMLYEPPHSHVVRTDFSGVIGTSEIRCGGKGRSLFTEIWLHANYSSMAILVQVLQGLDNAASEQRHGDLQITTGVIRTFKHCTFEGFTPDPLGPLPGTGSEIGFWCKGVLRWYQLTTQI